jgi:hypothetical protein
MKKFGFRFAGLVAVVGMFVMGSAAFAQVTNVAIQSVSTTIVILNTLTINAAAAAPNLTLGIADTSTTLTYSTNDGGTRSITVLPAAAGWLYAATTGTTNTATNWPTLSVTATVGGAGGQVIGADNTVNTQTLLTGIRNATGTLGVTLLANSSVLLSAGLYTTTLTYTLQ